MSFKTKTYEQLSCYRKKELKIQETGTWKGVHYGHILPKNKWKDNILEKHRDSFFSSDLRNIKFHMCFHHLNSSQAMCINFFYPIIMEKKLHLITDYMKFKNEKIDYQSVKFEKESMIDGKENRRPTNFDFYFKTESDKQFFFEIKYTEKEFGKTKNDLEHCDKYENVYRPLLAKKVRQEYTKKEEFFKYYQLIRNIIHIDKKTYVVFLYPKQNRKIGQSAIIAKEQIVNTDLSSHIFNITWEDIVSSLKTNSDMNKEHLSDFENKYLII